MEGLVPTITKLRESNTGTRENSLLSQQTKISTSWGKNTPTLDRAHLRVDKQAPKEQGRCPQSRDLWGEGRAALLEQLQSTLTPPHVSLPTPTGSRGDARFTYEKANATRAPLTTMKSRIFHRSRK